MRGLVVVDVDQDDLGGNGGVLPDDGDELVAMFAPGAVVCRIESSIALTLAGRKKVGGVASKPRYFPKMSFAKREASMKYMPLMRRFPIGFFVSLSKRVTVTKVTVNPKRRS